MRAVCGRLASTAYGDQVAADLAADLIKSGRHVITGGAFGIDAAAIRGALAQQRYSGAGKVIVALPCGTDRSYPHAHSALFEAVVENGGLILSLQEAAAGPVREAFIRRTRWVGRVAAATVIVEAAHRSSSLEAAASAASVGKPVFAVPGPITSTQSAGTNQLLLEKAIPIVDAHAARQIAAVVG